MLEKVQWSANRSYNTGGDNEPLEFYHNALCNSNQLDLLLGYFSSSAINVLSLGFAKFLHNGGRVRMVINDLLSAEDKQAYLVANDDGFDRNKYSLNNINNIKMSLDDYGKHFFECLAWLFANKLIDVKVVKPKNGQGISHYKSGVFSDGINKVGFKASCNFTAYGLLENLEELDAFLSWENSRSSKMINNQTSRFELIFNEEAEYVSYVDFSEIKTAIQDKFGGKDLNELIVDEIELIERKKNILKNKNIKESLEVTSNELIKIQNMPRFPYPEGPREYQINAYKNWVDNNRMGLFAMATGTGKTLTSLNCVLEDFKINNFYKFIILVPTTALANQWVVEVEKRFNFHNTILCCIVNQNWKSDIINLGKNILFGRDINYAIITTYASFKGSKFQTILKEHFNDDFNNITLIADEAHNIGSPGFLKVIPNIINKRIGLSATPERQFDVIGNNILNDFFSCTENKYTFEYNMKTAIENGILCKYYYYPVIVNLENDEQENYLKISKELLKYIDYETGKYRESEIVNNLLIKRKNIIHKAKNKLTALISIINKIGKDNFKKAFIYVPEGIEIDSIENEFMPEVFENETSKIIDNYIIEIYKKFQLKMSKFTGETNNRDQILKQFVNGNLDALLAMKCLDEGVDVPQTKYAIFCSSTGNPRQYIQRRGRVLRTHQDKDFAYIYDLIVKPNINQTNTDDNYGKMERNIFLSELRRLVNFAVLSENKDQSLSDLESLCDNLDIDIYELANNELNNYN